MSDFVKNLFGSPIDPEDLSEFNNKEEHVKLLTELCEEPQKMLEFHHRIREGYETSEGSDFINRKLESEKLRNEGNGLFSAGCHVEALQCYHKALKLTPNDPKLYSNACLCDMALGHFEDAVVDSYASFMLDHYYSKACGMLIASYCHIGYHDVVEKYVSLALSQFGSEYYNEAKKKIEKITNAAAFSTRRSLSETDLSSTVNRLFQQRTTEHPIKTYAYLLTHIAQHLEFDELGVRVDQLCGLDFVKKLLQPPLIKRLLSAETDLTKLDVYEALVLMLTLRISGNVLSINEENSIPPTIFNFMSNLSGFWLKDSTHKLIHQQKIAFGQLIFDYYSRILTTVASNKISLSRFFKSDPKRGLNWLLRLAPACFVMLNPVRFATTFSALLRLICLVSAQKWFAELVKNTSREQLVKAFGIFAAYGVICDRLMDYELTEDAFSELQSDEAYVLFWRRVGDCDETVFHAVATIPQVWMMFARRLSKNTQDPSEVAWPLLTLQRLLSPWAFETEDDLKPVIPHVFEDGPWFDIFLYSLSRLMLPARRFRKTIISAVGVASRFATASKRFAKKLLAEVPLTKMLKFHSQGVDDDGAAHFFAVSLGVVEDSTVRDLLTGESKEKFHEAISLALMPLMDVVNLEDNESLYAELYHSVIAFNRLMEIASRMEKSSLLEDVEVGKSLRDLVIQELEESFECFELADWVNGFISWIKRSAPKPQRKNDGKSRQQRKRGDRKQKRSNRRFDDDSDDEKFEPEDKLSLDYATAAVRKLFDVLSASDAGYARVLHQVKAKRRFH